MISRLLQLLKEEDELFARLKTLRVKRRRRRHILRKINPPNVTVTRKEGFFPSVKEAWERDFTFGLPGIDAISVPGGSVISGKAPQAPLPVTAIESESTPTHHCPLSTASTSSVLSTVCVSPTLNTAAQAVDSSSPMLPDSRGTTRPQNLKKHKITEDAILERLERIDQEKAEMDIDEDTAFCVFVAHMLSKLSVERRRATQLRILEMLHEAQKIDVELPEE